MMASASFLLPIVFPTWMPLAGWSAVTACAGPEVPVTTAAAPKKAVPTVNKASARDMDSACIVVTVFVFLLSAVCKLLVGVCTYIIWGHGP